MHYWANTPVLLHQPVTLKVFLRVFLPFSIRSFFIKVFSSQRLVYIIWDLSPSLSACYAKDRCLIHLSSWFQTAFNYLLVFIYITLFSIRMELIVLKVKINDPRFIPKFHTNWNYPQINSRSIPVGHLDRNRALNSHWQRAPLTINAKVNTDEN